MTTPARKPRKPGSGGARPNSGPRWRQKLTPFSANKEASTSYVKIAVWRCNACGCLWWEPYQEWIDRDHQIEMIEHPGQPEVHAQKCPMQKSGNTV